jgi:Cu-processing system permease protein
VSALVVARWTVLEARRRRLLLAGALLSVAFVALFAVGFYLLYRTQQRDLLEAQAQAQGAGPAGGFDAREELLAMSTILVILGLYGVQFLAALLGLFLGVASVSPEIDSGALHAVLARPLSRLQYLMGRFLALAGLLTVYVVVMSGALLLTARVVAGYRPGDVTRVVGLMVLQVLILLAVSLLGSTVLPTLANGVVMLVLFGLAWLGGIIGFVGTIPPGNELMANLGTAVSLLLPADAVWRGASYHVLPPSFLVASSFAGGGGDLEVGLPFGSVTPMAPAMLAWAVAYPVACLALAVAAFRRRDL